MTFLSSESPEIVRTKPRSSTREDLLEHYRAALRQEVREQELAALVAEIAQLRQDALDHRLQRGEEHRALLDELKRLQTPPPASSASLEALASQGLHGHSNQQRDADIPEGFELVADAFLDFIEICDLVNAAIVKRHPLPSKVRVIYNDQGQRELHYVDRGVYGLNPNMFNAMLTLVLDDPDLGPYVKGTYREYSQTVSMSPEQIDRVTRETLEAVRELWDEAHKS